MRADDAGLFLAGCMRACPCKASSSSSRASCMGEGMPAYLLNWVLLYRRQYTRSDRRCMYCCAVPLYCVLLLCAARRCPYCETRPVAPNQATGPRPPFSSWPPTARPPGSTPTFPAASPPAQRPTTPLGGAQAAVSGAACPGLPCQAAALAVEREEGLSFLAVWRQGARSQGDKGRCLGCRLPVCATLAKG